VVWRVINISVQGKTGENCVIGAHGLPKRRSLSHVCQELGWRAVYPKPKLCTDNGIMIGWAGYEFWKQQRGIVQPKDVFDVEVSPKCPLGENISDRVTATNLKCKWIKLDSSW